MNKKSRKIIIGISVLLFVYQSILDLKREELTVIYLELQHNFFPFLDNFVLAQKPGVFLLLFIIHRAFVHGLIISIYTNQKRLLKYYVATDLLICFTAFIFLGIHRIFGIDLYASGILLKLLNTPLLLLFFLPSYYIMKWESTMKKLSNAKSDPNSTDLT